VRTNTSVMTRARTEGAFSRRLGARDVRSSSAERRETLELSAPRFLLSLRLSARVSAVLLW
jgi:hypothetical protein